MAVVVRYECCIPEVFITNYTLNVCFCVLVVLLLLPQRSEVIRD